MKEGFRLRQVEHLVFYGSVILTMGVFTMRGSALALITALAAAAISYGIKTHFRFKTWIRTNKTYIETLGYEAR